MIGEARVTSMRAGSLSRVTVRGAERTFASEFLFKKENTALTPSASRNAVAGLNPLAVSNSMFGKLLESVLLRESAGEFCWRLLPKARCWFANVPDQSSPLLVVGFIEEIGRA